MKKILKWGIIGLLGLFAFFVIIVISGDEGRKSFEEGRQLGLGNIDVDEPETILEVEKKKIISKPVYEQIGYKEFKEIENIDFLIADSQVIKNAGVELEDEARKAKDDRCRKPCNISFWDDEKAYRLEQERQKLLDAGNADGVSEWDEANYDFVAKHLIGWLSFEDIFMSYPWK